MPRSRSRDMGHIRSQKRTNAAAAPKRPALSRRMSTSVTARAKQGPDRGARLGAREQLHRISDVARDSPALASCTMPPTSLRRSSEMRWQRRPRPPAVELANRTNDYRKVHDEGAIEAAFGLKSAPELRGILCACSAA